MKVISTGSKFDIYPDNLKSYDKLPADYYVVRYIEKQGVFFLEKYSEFKITDTKIYGIHEQKADKVLDSFADFKRNLGVILSGDKGIGKSLLRGSYIWTKRTWRLAMMTMTLRLSR